MTSTNGAATRHSLWDRQQQLYERCRHPTGDWHPLEWQVPEQAIPERIAALARQAPGRLAVYDHQAALTYSALDQAANRVANAILAERGPGQEAVALLVGVDAPAITAALGVLKAGKIYVGLEASFPQKRSRQILDHAQATVIVTDGQRLALARDLAGTDGKVIQLERLADGDERAPGVSIPLDALAILNYTSGSTGQPKGVAQSHLSAFAQAVRFASYYHVCHKDRVAFFGSLAWAGSFWTVFGPLCLGASIGPLDFRQHGMRRLTAWLQETQATLVVGLAVVRQIAYDNPEERFSSVRLVHMGGDTIYRRDVQACMRVFPNALIAVGLGTTEAGRVTEFLFDSPEMPEEDVVPLGFPVPGLRIRLLSDDGKAVAQGEVGEIAALSHHLAAGYWRLPDLTAARFPSAGVLGAEPAYLTGDLGRQRPDGCLEHVGRKDYRVKIRGYQVYTNEIEAMLRGVEGVREACVVAHALPEGAQRLAAYLVVDRRVFAGPGALHARFVDLPAHMVPQSYVYLDALPKTPTGKIDRQHLPLPRHSRLNVTAEHVAPRNPTEEVLTEIWREVLAIEGLGVNDDFLQLGGDSLQATRIVNRVVERLGVPISLGELLSAPTIAEMATIIRSHEARPGPKKR